MILLDRRKVVTSEEEDDGPIEMVDEINDAFSSLVEEDRTIGGSNVTVITGHEWKFENLYLRVKWNTGQETLELLMDMKLDHPVLTAKYILENEVSRSKCGGNRDLQWAKKTMRDIKRLIKRIRRMYDFEIDANDCIIPVKKIGNRKKKKVQEETSSLQIWHQSPT